MEMVAAIWLAMILDQLIGDPQSRFHPVILMGNSISFLEKHLRKETASPLCQMLAGTVLVIVLLTGVYGSVFLFLHSIQEFFVLPAGSISLISACFLLFAISPKSLAAAGREIYQYLQQGDLTQARVKVGWIVGRDTDKLDVPNVTRATVETIAENIVDGIISPLFFFLLGGAPLAMLYRAANTMDSMLGYKNDKYLYFGRPAARLDDLLNYIPARLTGILLILSAILLQFDWKNACQMMLRDAKKHPSPNGGYPESAVAGALGVQLGGLNYYFGKPSFRAYMGEPQQMLEPIHILQTIRMMYSAVLLFAVLASVLILWEKGGF